MEAAEAAAAAAAADAQRLQAEQQQLVAEVAAAQQALQEAVAAGEAQMAAALAPLRQELAEAQEAVQRGDAAAQQSRLELERVTEEARQLSASLAASQQEALRLQQEFEAAASERAAAEEEAGTLQEQLAAVQQQHHRLQQAAQAAAAVPGSASPDSDSGGAFGSPQEAPSAASPQEAPAGSALLVEREQLRAQLADAEKKASSGLLVQQAKVAALEKQNRELSWQVAMLTRGGGAGSGSEAPVQRRLGTGGPPGSVAVPMPAAALEGAAERPVAVALGWVLRHRRGLLAAYGIFLHVLVYWTATMLSHCNHGSTAGVGGTAAGLPGT